MARLYELSADFARLFDEFDAINNIENELAQQDNGMYLDSNGNVILDIVEYKEELLAAWFDTLDGIEAEIEIKADNTACVIKDLKAEAAAIDTEIKRLTLRKKSAERQAKRLSEYLLEALRKIGQKKISTPRSVVSISEGRGSLIVENEQAFIEWAQSGGHEELLNFKQPDISKKAVKAALEEGGEIPFVHIENKPSISIK